MPSPALLSTMPRNRPSVTPLRRAVLGLAAAALALVTHTAPASAQFSNCQAIAQDLPGAVLVPVSFQPREVSAEFEVEITYVGHASFRITAPDGTAIVTDYSGHAGEGKTPDVVTMNHAHITHWTPNPDPAIPNVLTGWNPNGDDPIAHMLQVGEVLIRNVTTDIRSAWAGVELDGNSIFIFEVQGLCIGHVGHLHQELSDSQYAQVGRLDVVMVPIDGGTTMSHAAMMRVVKRLRSSIVIPMHWFSQFSLSEFVRQTSPDDLVIEVRQSPTMRISLNTLPRRPTLMVMPRQFGF